MAAGEPSSPRLHAAGSPHAGRLLDAGVDMAYQPIVQLGSGAVIAYEALARPRFPGVPEPLDYFAALESGGLLLAGERQAFRAAVAGASGQAPRMKLFVNASPSTLLDPAFDVVELLELVEEHGLSASDLVIEVTESQAIHDLEGLAHRTTRLRRLGIGLAVDDAGAGHSSFRVITRLRPSYIKIDRELVSGVDADGARHAFIDALVRFSRQIGSRLIAEGIETDSELVALAGLGVDAGQGYYLARPGIGEFAVPSPASRRMIASTAQRLRLGAAQVTVGELAHPAVVIPAGATVREAYARFLSEPSLGTLVLTDPGGSHPRFTGQLTRRALERYLASPDAWSELADRTVGDIADRRPLTVMAPLDLVEVAAVIGARHQQEVVDDVVVTDPRGALVGVVSMRDVLRALSDVRHQDDRDVNPLSGLLGSGWIEGELSRRLDAEEATTILFVDIDGFRRINDLGGFSAGDEVLRALGRSLAGVTAGIEDAAVAHVGADDFVLLVPPHGYEELVGELVRSVESEVAPVMRTVLGLWPGTPEAKQLALSIGAVDLVGQPPPGHRYLEWAQNLLSPLIQTAKDHTGYACMHRSGRSTVLATWNPTRERRRSLGVGLAEPSVVLRALTLIDEAIPQWSSEAEQRGELDRVPYPIAETRGLVTRYAAPLRARADEARRRGDPVMEVAFEGDEDELLGMLDRIALITHTAPTKRRLPVPPERALLDRLLRQRARVLVRQDIVGTGEGGS